MQNFLTNYINQKNNKMITYAEYINLVLYHPALGYYMREGEKIGRAGDFITTSNIADIFGRTMAKWYAESVKNKSLPPHICEIGAGNGRFAKAFLQEWYASDYPELTYCIIEKSPYHMGVQREQFEEKWSVRQYESLAEMEPFSGLIFSNELFDALPVHVIKKQSGQLFEMMITTENGKLVERGVPLLNKEIFTFIEEHQLNIAEGHRMEIPLQMEDIVSQMDKVLLDGLIVTVDYGYSNEEWQEPARRDGSLRGYYQHNMINNVLDYPGQMDITSHIHWDILKNIGEKHGLHTVGKWRQDEFLIKSGILNELQSHHDPNPFSEVNKRNRAIRSLVMPTGMSAAFHVLVQER